MPEQKAPQSQKQIIKNIREIYKTTPVYEKLYLRSDINLIVAKISLIVKHCTSSSET